MCNTYEKNNAKITEYYKENIIMEHPNGYTGCIYGKSSLVVTKDDKKVFHTASRTVNTADELFEFLEKFDETLKDLFEL